MPPGSFQLLIFASCSFPGNSVKDISMALLLTPELLCVAPMKTGEYKIWQICSDGIIDGIEGYVDIDILYK